MTHLEKFKILSDKQYAYVYVQLNNSYFVPFMTLH